LLSLGGHDNELHAISQISRGGTDEALHLGVLGRPGRFKAHERGIVVWSSKASSSAIYDGDVKERCEKGTHQEGCHAYVAAIPTE
jgi:hypothetical protein